MVQGLGRRLSGSSYYGSIVFYLEKFPHKVFHIAGGKANSGSRVFHVILGQGAPWFHGLG